MFEMRSAAMMTRRGRKSASAYLGWTRYQSSGSLSLCVCLSHASFLSHNPPKFIVGRLRRDLANLISCLSYCLRGPRSDRQLLNPSYIQLSRGTKGQHRTALGWKMTRSGGLRDSGRMAVVDAHVLDRPGFLAAASGNCGHTCLDSVYKYVAVSRVGKNRRLGR